MSGTAVTLDNCDREPIHIPGSIQPHGCLLACDDVAATIRRHSGNAAKMLGLAADPIGQPLDDVLGPDNAHAVRNALARADDPARPALLFELTAPSGRSFDVAAHRFDGAAIL